MAWPEARWKTVVLMVVFILVVGGMSYLFVPGDDGDIWFDDWEDRPALAASDEHRIVKRTGAAVLHDRPLNDIDTRDRHPRIVFVSVSDGLTKARIIMGTGMGIDRAVADALSVIEDLKQGGYVPVWLAIDIVDDVETVVIQRWNTRSVIAGGLSGVAFPKETGIALLPSELVAARLITGRGALRSDKIGAYTARTERSLDRLFHENPPPLHVFTTRSWFTDGTEVVPLYRGHRTYDTVSREEVRQALRAAAGYMKHSVDTEGRFAYSYRPDTDTLSHRYNILRHAGTVYAMLELYELADDAKLMAAAQRALDYLVKRCRSCPCLAGAACVEEKGFVKLGGNALALIALAKYFEVTSDRRYLPLMKQLARWIQWVQREDGSFDRQKVRYADCHDTGFVSDYYPGEAILAMLRLYAIDGDERWLDVAEGGAAYLVETRDFRKDLARLSHDHWLLYALHELGRYRPRPAFDRHALRIAEAIMHAQNLSPQYPDWRGSFYRPPRSTPTATRVEGLAAAYRIAVRNGKVELSERIFSAITEGIRFQLQTQLGPESVLHVKNPARALGGFRRSLTNYGIRIDYVQHNISSLIAFYRIRDAVEKELKQ